MLAQGLAGKGWAALDGALDRALQRGPFLSEGNPSAIYGQWIAVGLHLIPAIGPDLWRLSYLRVPPLALREKARQLSRWTIAWLAAGAVDRKPIKAEIWSHQEFSSGRLEEQTDHRYWATYSGNRMMSPESNGDQWETWPHRKDKLGQYLSFALDAHPRSGLRFSLLDANMQQILPGNGGPDEWNFHWWAAFKLLGAISYENSVPAEVWGLSGFDRSRLREFIASQGESEIGVIGECLDGCRILLDQQIRRWRIGERSFVANTVARTTNGNKAGVGCCLHTDDDHRLIYAPAIRNGVGASRTSTIVETVAGRPRARVTADGVTLVTVWWPASTPSFHASLSSNGFEQFEPKDPPPPPPPPPPTRPRRRLKLSAVSYPPMARLSKGHRFFRPRRYLAGSHTWDNLQDYGRRSSDFDWSAYLRFLTDHHHSAVRMWQWEGSAWRFPPNAPPTDTDVNPLPYEIRGNGKFDLNTWNDEFFTRLRQRVEDLGDRGIYALVMLHQEYLDATTHPLVRTNNVQGEGVAPNMANQLHSLDNPAYERQRALVRKTVRELSDQDNVLWEVGNELKLPRSEGWQRAMINLLHQIDDRPVLVNSGFADGAADNYKMLMGLGADGVAWPTDREPFEPPVIKGTVPHLSDTDHTKGVLKSRSSQERVDWLWKSFTSGLHALSMESIQHPPPQGGDVNNPSYSAVRRAMGQAVFWSQRMAFGRMAPRGGYVLASDEEMLAYFSPGERRRELRLPTASRLRAEWFDSRTGEFMPAPDVTGGTDLEFFAPFDQAILYLYSALLDRTIPPEWLEPDDEPPPPDNEPNPERIFEHALFVWERTHRPSQVMLASGLIGKITEGEVNARMDQIFRFVSPFGPGPIRVHAEFVRDRTTTPDPTETTGLSGELTTTGGVIHNRMLAIIRNLGNA